MRRLADGTAVVAEDARVVLLTPDGRPHTRARVPRSPPAGSGSSIPATTG
jgi:hypothetical protein